MVYSSLRVKLFMIFYAILICRVTNVLLCTPPVQRPGNGVGGERRGRAGGLVLCDYLMNCTYIGSRKWKPLFGANYLTKVYF